MNPRHCLVLLCLLALPAFGTQIEYRSLPQLAQESQLVVQGRVLEVRSLWNDDRSRILTEVTLEVEAAHKGAAPQQVRVLQAGGVLDGVRMTVHGAPSWGIGQDVLLFLEPSLPGSHRLSGFTQGRFELQRDPASGEWMASRPLFGVEIAGKRSDELRLPLETLLQQAFAQEGDR